MADATWTARGLSDDNLIGVSIPKAFSLKTMPLQHIKSVTASIRRESVSNLVMIVAPTIINVLIQGGCAAERVSVAGAIHELSERRHGPFVRVNCSELCLDRLEAELFGNVSDRVAGSGFARCRTHFEDAFNGTLFLNNVDSLPGRVQLRLLQALKNRELLKRSAKRRYKIDVRLIASSEINLATLVKRGQFDQELYNLLKIFAIDVPSNDN